MANPLDKARELGSAILSSAEYTNLKQAELDMHENVESLKLFQSINRSEADKIVALGDKRVSRYIDCQKRYDSLMRDINTIISYYTGHIAVKGDCSSCGGCGSESKQ